MVSRPSRAKSLRNNKTVRPRIRAELKFRLPPVACPVDPSDEEYGLEALDVSAGLVTRTPRGMLAGAALAHSMPADAHQALTQREPVAVLVETPTPAWAEAVACHAPSAYPGARVISATKAPARGATLDCPPPTAPIIAISSNRSWLSPIVLAGADFAIRLELTAESLRKVISTYCNVEAGDLTASDFAGLDLTDLAFAMRPHSSPKTVIDRLRRAVEAKASPTRRDHAPLLEEMATAGAAARRLCRIADDFVKQRERDGEVLLPNILLFGPPGTGKTTLAKSFARTVNAPFIQSSVAEWFTSGTGHLGDVASAAQRFFDRAAMLAPSVALLDEIDAIPSRETMDERDRSWWAPIITGFLMQVDTLRKRSRGVVLIAATNYKNKLDPALVRPGRFDLHIEVLGPQTDAEIEAVFRQCLKEDLEDQDLSPAVRMAGKPTAASIEAWVKRAQDSAKSRPRRMALRDLVDAIAPPDTRPVSEIEEIALHEAAHVVVAVALGQTVRSASIVDSATAGGVTHLGSASPIFSRDDLERKAITILAGRASDERFSRGATSGAASDLWTATAIVTDVHLRFGLGERLVAREAADPSLLSLDPALRSVVEADLRRLMTIAREQVERLQGPIRKIATLLIERRVLSTDDIDEALGPGFDKPVAEPGEAEI